MAKEAREKYGTSLLSTPLKTLKQLALDLGKNENQVIEDAVMKYASDDEVKAKIKALKK